MEPGKSLNILIVEDEPDTARMLDLLLKKKLEAKCEIVQDCAALKSMLPTLSTDLITLDYQLPDGDGLALLREINSTNNPPPVVMVTGHGDERTAVEAFREGASGYVVKDSRLSILLVQEVKSALLKRELRNAELELMGREEMLMHVYKSAAESIIVGDSKGNFEYVNPMAASLFGFDTPEEMIGTPVADRYANPEERDELLARLMEQGTVNEYLLELRRKDGTTFFTEINAALFKDAAGKLLRTTAYTSYRKQQDEVEEARRLSEEKYRQMFDNMTDGIIVFQAVDDGNDFIITDFNNASDLYISRQYIGKSVFEYNPNAEETPVFKMIQEVWRTGEFASMPPTYYCDENNSGWVQGYAYKLTTGEVVTTFNNITEIMETQHELEESREMLARIYDLAAEGIIVTDSDQRIEYANSHALELMGYSDLEEVEGETAESWYVDKEYRKKMLFVLAEKGCVKDLDFELRRKDGTTIWARFNVSVERDEEGNYKRAIGLMTDITARKAYEDALRNSESMLSRIYDLAAEGVVVTDSNHRLEYANPHALDMLGYTDLEEIRGISTEAWYVDPEARRVYFPILMEEGIVKDVDIEFKRTDGSTFWARLNVSVEKDESGEFQRGFTFMRDITYGRQYEESLKLANKELEAYAHTVSHHLKGPFSNIALASEMLSSDIADSLEGEDADLLETVQKNAVIGNQRIESLLRLAESGQRPLAVEDLDIREVIDEILRILSVRIGSIGCKVMVDDDLGRLRASRPQVQQVFANVIENAIKHNDSEKPEIRVFYKGLAPDGARKYQVSDNGSGIPEGELENIFTPFYKISGTSETGLGLSIARKIAHLYGGDIVAKNDRGAIFEITLRDFDHSYENRPGVKRPVS